MRVYCIIMSGLFCCRCRESCWNPSLRPGRRSTWEWLASRTPTGESCSSSRSCPGRRWGSRPSPRPTRTSPRWGWSRTRPGAGSPSKRSCQVRTSLEFGWRVHSSFKNLWPLAFEVDLRFSSSQTKWNLILFDRYIFFRANLGILKGLVNAEALTCRFWGAHKKCLKYGFSPHYVTAKISSMRCEQNIPNANWA